MTKSIVRGLAIGLYLLYVLAITWPGATLFRSPEPLVFGLPSSMAWPVAWILIGLVTLLVLDHFENRDE